MSAPRRTPPAAPPGEAVTGAAARPVVRVDILELLRRYREAIELADDPPASRRARLASITRLLTWLRPTWGLHRLVVEHVRGRIALVDRHFARRLALGEQDPNDAEDRDALSLFDTSLPPPRSRLWVALPLLALVAVSQLLLALLLLGRDGLGAPAQKVITDLVAVADLNPGHPTTTLDTFLHSDPKVTALALGVLTLSVYIVWRPLLPAFRLKRIILAMPAAIGPRTGRSELGARAQKLGVHAEELALFAALGLRPPRERELDLRVKLALVAIFAALAALMLAPPDPVVGLGLFFLVLAGMRLGWLAREARRRRPRARSAEDARG